MQQIILNIIIDTREQTPWRFPDHLTRTMRGTLPTGDYALAGDAEFAIERKSLDDFLGSISSDWERFQREMIRMQGWCARAIIVEADFSRCCFRRGESKIDAPEHHHPRLSPAFIARRIAELTMQNISCLFAGNPGQACALAYQILKLRNVQLINERAE